LSLFYKSNHLFNHSNDKIQVIINRLLGFYDMNEVPPVVNIKVDSLTTLSFKGEAANISTKYTGIIESNYKRDAYTEYELQNKDSSFGKGTVSEFDK